MDKYNLYTPEKDPGMADFGDCHMPDRLALALGFCPCGQPEILSDDLAEYLRDMGSLVTSNRHYWASMAADKLELTEHGGSVFGAWITEYGAEWLSEYESWKKGNVHV